MTPDPNIRGSGMSTKQMREAEQGVVFVTPTHPGYWRDLARKLGREDLRIVPHFILRAGSHRLRGQVIPGLVIDHALVLTEDERVGLDLILPYVRPS